ncbi:Rv0361 family membrane protein [Rhodococcus sp. WMMA185]|uniref:Rv0361 family membrane protein n=1 Tax=Rhodococcus sp. WMMA185 TaxID=679318 RepID=UPI000878E54D|nr:nuclear transport factor 2 family protein [Rhodococcus sp. WMMA185]
MKDPKRDESTPRPEASDPTPAPEASDSTPRPEAEAATVAFPKQTVPPYEAETVAIPVQQPQNTEPAPPRATPQRVPPAPQIPPVGPPTKRRGKTRPLSIAVGVIVLAVVAIAGAVIYQNQVANSPRAQVQGAIDTFVAALTQGDLEALRASTCGELAEYYQSIPDQEFADIHRAAVSERNIPVVGDVDAVQITGDTAIAQLKAHTTANPDEQSWRTFNLQKVDGSWKICDPS